MDENQLLTEVLWIEKLEVRGSKIVGAEGIYLNVKPLLKVGICPYCNEISLHEHDRGEEQEIRDLTIAGRRCWLLMYRPRRFCCERCEKTFVERVEWRRGGMS